MPDIDHPQVLQNWEQVLTERLALFGHRNWIVIADSAYPAQANPGIEMIVADAPPLQVIRRVLDKVNACRHVDATVYTDQELEYVAESDAPGVFQYRQHLSALLTAATVRHLLHEQIIARLDESARLFRVLIIKTELAIPYTSVFLELGCGYWTSSAEQRLHAALEERRSRVN
jgi:L-fucose mutarotase/ribose pyranase (RbsD/FucU family)